MATNPAPSRNSMDSKAVNAFYTVGIRAFGGRVGLFHSQPADKLLDAADVVIAIGYNPIEYEPALWNRGRSRDLIHIDVMRVDIDRDYRPRTELTGNIAGTIRLLTASLEARRVSADSGILDEIVTLRNFPPHRKPFFSTSELLTHPPESLETP